MSLPNDPSTTPESPFSPRSFLVQDTPPASAPRATAGPAPTSRPTATPAARPAASGTTMGRRAAMVGMAGALIVTAIGGGAVGATLTRLGPAATPPTPVAAPAVTGASAVQPTSGSVAANVYRMVSPAVVQITNRGAGMFGGGGTGSGFVIDASGLILTNNHVIEGARSLSVALPDGRKFTAKVLGRSPENDIALLKIDAPGGGTGDGGGGGLPTVALGDSAAIQPGDIAIAIGSPLGLDKTVTSGIVSAVNRDMTTWQVSLKGLIQTDAAINPGNSGGPLLNEKGEVIGINTLGAMGISGIGFAVPINTAKQLLPQLKAGANRP
ncbi:MAG: trypsin-like peptidase domain-containing protein [Chloroflexi bacterium]|nr:trypsin-like peptidase domain-containing protein [Chloroflexota bacterium]